MKCKVCGEEHRATSDGEEVPRYVRGACKCERREACGVRRDCTDKVVAVLLEPDGVTTDCVTCRTHLPSGFDADDFVTTSSDMVPIAEEEPPKVTNFEASDVVCADCQHPHKDRDRVIFFRVYKTQGRMVQVTGCPKCRSIFMNAA